MIYLEFDEAAKYIKEGDVLLFRGDGFISQLISRIGKGVHSHVAMASWRAEPGSSTLECVEFREFRGGRTVTLKSQVNNHPGKIDVFRVSPSYTKVSFVTGEVITQLKYDGLAATNYLRDLTGLPYGWERIWTMLKRHISVLRLFLDPVVSDEESDQTYPVCSTAVCRTIQHVYVDPVPYKPNWLVEPADLARSSLLNYMFTLGTPEVKDE